MTLTVEQARDGIRHVPGSAERREAPLGSVRSQARIETHP